MDLSTTKISSSELFIWHLESVADLYSEAEAQASFEDWLQVFRYQSALNTHLLAAQQLFHENDLAMKLINQYKEINNENK